MKIEVLKKEGTLFETDSAYVRDDHPGFKEDYLALHSILKRSDWMIKTVFEIGTNTGEGVNVICKALPEAQVFSLDLDYESMMKNTTEFPIGPNGEDRVGSAVKPWAKYTQLRGDSKTFPYQKYTPDAYFIDGEHTKEAVLTDTLMVLKTHPEFIIWHDADMPDVLAGIKEAFEIARPDLPHAFYENLYIVEGTRIAFTVIEG